MKTSCCQFVCFLLKLLISFTFTNSFHPVCVCRLNDVITVEMVVMVMSYVVLLTALVFDKYEYLSNTLISSSSFLVSQTLILES